MSIRLRQVAVILLLPLSFLFLPCLAGDAAAAAKGKTGKPGKKGGQAPKVDVKNWELPNGLQVLFLADRKAPIATVQLFYHVGSKDERPGIRGIAHMFEHMMFKGSERVAPEEHARLVKEVGGSMNAFTNEDITGYHQTVPPSYIGFAMQLEAERMRSLRLSAQTVASEKRVVQEEKRLRIDNSPFGKALERFRALAFTKHPYNWTAIGTMEDLEAVKPEDCKKFYDAYYVPNNATLVVVGDVDEAEVKKLAEQHFGPIAKGPAPPRVTLEEPAQDKMRFEEMQIDVQVPILVGGYKVPRASDPDTAPLEVLGNILSAGDSSRLHQRLVRKEKLALAALGQIQPLEHPGLFIVAAAHLPDKDQAKIKDMLFEEIARVRQEPISPAELDKAKNQLAAQYIRGLETVDGVAEQLGHAHYVHGDWREFLKGADRYLGVTAKDVKRVAEKYLIETNLTLVALKPSGRQAPAGGGAKSGGAK